MAEPRRHLAVQLEPDGEWRSIIVPFAFKAALAGIDAGVEVHERIRYRHRFRVADDRKLRGPLGLTGATSGAHLAKIAQKCAQYSHFL